MARVSFVLDYLVNIAHIGVYTLSYLFVFLSVYVENHLYHTPNFNLPPHGP